MPSEATCHCSRRFSYEHSLPFTRHAALIFRRSVVVCRSPDLSGKNRGTVVDSGSSAGDSPQPGESILR